MLFHKVGGRLWIGCPRLCEDGFVVINAAILLLVHPKRVCACRNSLVVSLQSALQASRAGEGDDHKGNEQLSSHRASPATSGAIQ